MSSFKKFQTAVQEEAFAVLKNGAAKIESFQAECATHFAYPTLSKATEEFASVGAAATNPKMTACVSSTLDVMDAVGKDLQLIETFLNMHIPKMEDGNNFGVTVQLALLKQISDTQEALGKNIESLSGYAASRADVLDKLSLPSSSSTTTKSSSSTTTDGKKEDKSSESTEEKQTAGNPSSVSHTARLGALVTVDSLYYSKAQRAALSAIASYMAVLDFLEKNQEKLKQPKGSAGSRSAYSGMY
uniref:Proteasome activator PA28 C-terminal domain-containing protein n=1 Tax=Craspedostauros australis TaxID=1486917 RepID=A0A7R9WNP6_9STRA